MIDKPVWRGFLRRRRDAVRACVVAKDLRVREKQQFRQAFAEFWQGDDDCWDEGRTDSLADAAFIALLRGDTEGAVQAVVRRAEKGLGLRMNAGCITHLRRFLTEYEITGARSSARRPVAV